MKRLPSQKPAASGSGDKRHFTSDETAQARVKAGRRGRGTNALEWKADPALQERIDLIVEKSLRDQSSGNGVDVIPQGDDIRGDHWIRLSGLRASRVG